MHTFTEEEKAKIVSSVYSNPKKLKIATFIYEKKRVTANQVIESLNIPKPRVYKILQEMDESGIIEKTDDYIQIIQLTKFGKKLMGIFD